MTQGVTAVFGEVLFDHFPDGRRVLGGAPFNVAWHLQAFGERPLFISRVGRDEEGAEVRRAMCAWGMRTDGLQTDAELPTGRVGVRWVDGEPDYEIEHPSAFDAIEADSFGESPGLVYHGSLALRESRSRAALDAILASASAARVFMDVNLRAPWWRAESVRAWVERADWVKLNRAEMRELEGTGSDRDEGEAALEFLTASGLEGLLVTRGHRGAFALTAGGENASVAPDAATDIVDTVGAGDAFAAVTILGLIRGWPLNLTLDRAQAFAVRICGVRGATVDDPDFYRPAIEAWGIGQ